MDKFGFDEVTSSAGDVQQDAVGSLLTTGGMMDGTDSATARHEDEAKRNPNGTADVIDRKGFVGETVYLAEVCHPTQWKTLPTSELLDEGFPVYGANGIIGYYSEYNHENPVVAITCRGATCGTVNITMPKAYVTGNAMCLDDVRRDINIYYLFYAVKAMDYTNIISGSAQPQITRRGLSKAKIKVIDSKNQKVVVETLQKIEGLIGLRKQQLEQLDTLIKARFVEMFGDTVNNTKGWNEERLDEYIEFLTSGSRGWSRYFTDEENEVFITIKNVKNNHIELDNIQYIKPPQNKEAERTKVRAGDLLISITADLGRTGVVDKVIAEKGAYINQHLSLVRLKQGNLLPLYLSHFLESDGGKRQFDSKNQTGVKAGLNFDAIKSLKVLVPPIELQNQFADFVTQIDKLKVEVQKSLDKMQILFDSLMQEYFG